MMIMFVCDLQAKGVHNVLVNLTPHTLEKIFLNKKES